MSEPVHIAHWIFDLGLGGDAKNLVSLASEQSKWSRVSILTQTNDPGPRAKTLIAQGINIIAGILPSETLSAWLTANRPHILIVHRNGAPNEVEKALVEMFHHSGVSCFEYNTFARVDASTDDLWSGHIHLSRASFTQYAKRRNMSPLDLLNHKAVGYAVPLARAVTNAERDQARLQLGVPADAFVVARIVRPDLRKWDPMPVLAVERLATMGVPACLLVRAVPDARQNWVKSVLGKSVICLPPSIEEEQLRLTWAACDAVVNYSVIGETFGLALAEAMAAGLPVIVNSTPDADNAQIELCHHNQTGLVANTITSLAESLKYLHDNPQLRKDFAERGRHFMETTFAPKIVEARLRNFIISCLESSGNGLSSAIQPPVIDKDDYLLTAEWLSQYEKSQELAFVDHHLPVTALLDNWQLKMIRLEDAFLYARSIGIIGIFEKFQRRLSQGSIFRK